MVQVHLSRDPVMIIISDVAPIIPPGGSRSRASLVLLRTVEGRKISAVIDGNCEKHSTQDYSGLDRTT